MPDAPPGLVSAWGHNAPELLAEVYTDAQYEDGKEVTREGTAT